MKKGDVLAYSWGYDQTNVDFFQVTRTTAKTAWIRPIADQISAGKGNSMTGTAKPIINRFTGPEVRKRIKQYNHCGQNSEPYLAMDHGVASPYKHPMHCSWYG